MVDCYFDNSGCYVCPELPAVPTVPAHTVVDPRMGWNAGANSIALLAGDVAVSDSFDVAPIGIIVGFKTTRLGNTSPSAILHGLYFYTIGHSAFVEVRESGRLVGVAVAYTAGAAFSITRAGNRIFYELGGALLAITRAASLDPLLVNACLYVAGDTVP